MPSELRAWARLVIPGLVGQGFGVTRIVSQLRTMGLSYRRQDMFRDVNELRDLNLLKQPTQDLPWDSIPKRNVMVETELKQFRKYRIYANVTYRDVKTGAESRQIISFYSNERRTKDEWITEYIDMKTAADYRPDVYVAQMDIWGIEHNRGWSY